MLPNAVAVAEAVVAEAEGFGETPALAVDQLHVPRGTAVFPSGQRDT